LILILLLCLLGLPNIAAAQESSDTGSRVRAIFAAKCLECHNPDSENSKARRNFDGLWDMQLTIEEWGDPFAYDLAPLWEAVEEGSMPPEDAEVAPLTEEEIVLLQAWIRADMPLPADGNRFVDLQMAARELSQSATATTEEVIPERGFNRRLSIWLGRNHAALTHFPVALLLLAALMRLLQWGPWRERAWHAEGFCLLFGTPFAAITAALGWLNAANSGAAGGVLERHRWLGIGIVSAALLLLLVRGIWGRRKWFGLLLALLALAVAIAGHQGGELVFGEGYLDY
jgi:mono/diheme cytochrome c family protein/uncharacterized membrane protein